MSLRAIGAFAIGLFAVSLLASPALAKSCYCEIAVGCPKYDDHVTLKDFDAIESYGTFESYKKSKCATACTARSATEKAVILANGEAWCDLLGLGEHPVRAYSVVGHTDSHNNWCDPDDSIGVLVCERVCDCPPGYTFDPDSRMCHGECNGISVSTFPTSCDVQHHWQ